MSSVNNENKLLGLLLISTSVVTYSLIHYYTKAKHFEDAYWSERRGRGRVEMEMRKISDIQLNTTDGFFVQPVAKIESCFRQCVGTPRQGSLVPSSRATLILENNVSPESLDGLEEFSHVWIFFHFHLNSNVLKEAKSFNSANGAKGKFTFKGKITPPMLKEKKGVFATRTPHRPNPIGVTLARVESVNKKTRSVKLSACDLVDGTPVLDFKPYVPAYDTVPSFKIPKWIEETIDTRNKVVISKEAIANIHFIQKKLKQYKNDPDAFIQALQETLEADVRSIFQTKRRIEDANNDLVVEVLFDETIVRFLWKEERKMEVKEVVLAKDVIKEEFKDISSETLAVYNTSDKIYDK